MNYRLWQENGRTMVLHVVLLLLATVCAVTVLKSTPMESFSFHGHDFETISGTRSTTEVFSRGGRYVLHDYSPRTPICTHCKQMEVQVDTGLHVEAKGIDFFNRSLAMVNYTVRPDFTTSAVVPAASPVMTGRTIMPDLPPPRV